MCLQAICDFLRDIDWETFTLIYEGPESLIVMQEVLKERMGRSKYDRPAVVMKELPESVDEFKSVGLANYDKFRFLLTIFYASFIKLTFFFRPFLKQIKNSSETHIMLHCSPETTVVVLEKAKEVDLLGPYQSFFIPSLVIIYFFLLSF